MESVYKTYPHNPPHFFVPNAMYIVTGSILHKKRLLFDDERKALVLGILLERAAHWEWDMEAWSILENRYHFLSRAPENALTLGKLIRQFHSKTALELNRLDKSPGRQNALYSYEPSQTWVGGERRWIVLILKMSLIEDSGVDQHAGRLSESKLPDSECLQQQAVGL